MSRQMKLLKGETEVSLDGPVECLGLVFANDTERRAYFTDLLREKLQDPEFRKIEGFPIGEDEDILSLSDPPYYTACPNPWIAEFIQQWETEKPKKSSNYEYHREPYAADVSEGKNDPIYTAHSYHTKVPYKAIMRYILHYTEPGDIVFDGFCGTGMTGVAARMCGEREIVLSLGNQVRPDGTILREEVGDDGKKLWKPFSKLGARRAILNDLSPAATFIAHYYNTPVNVAAFKSDARRILMELENECGWLYETTHTDGSKGKINYSVWSDVFICPECIGEVVFWEAAVDKDAGKVMNEFSCPHCSASLTKRKMDRAWLTKFDSGINKKVRQAKQIPVIINYTTNGKREEKVPDAFDLALLKKIESSEISYWYPIERMPQGKETRRNDPIGITHVHHFYSRRNLWGLAKIHDLLDYSSPFSFVYTSMILRSTIMNRIVVGYHFHGGGGANGAHLKGTLYVSSLPTETAVPAQIRNKTISNAKVFDLLKDDWRTLLFTQSSTRIDIPSSSLDYIFLDPPFGSNLYYSELNFLWESWLKVWTNNIPEAIENSAQGKGLYEYRQLMIVCFKEAYRVLKPGHWMTVEFSNTKASVWNSIQTALTEAGFIVANVSALDKKQGSFKAVTTPTAVKQDLVISVYKPNGGFEDRFREEAITEKGVWDFTRTHLSYLPVIKRVGAALQVVPERDPRMLYDLVVAFYVRKGFPVPISSPEFQVGVAQRFIERDGMYFLPAQASEYDREKMTSSEIVQISLFVSDEASAIQWLRQLLKEKPQTFADISPQFMRRLGGWSKNEQQLDLRELLNQNFLSYDDNGLVPEQIHAYLSSNWKDLRNLSKDDPALRAKAKDRWYVPDPNKAADLEKLRERHLLREYETYRESKQRKLKVFRLEAVRAGFKKAWQERDYETIIAVAKKIPDKVLQKDPKLLMWYDQALTRTGGADW